MSAATDGIRVAAVIGLAAVSSIVCGQVTTTGLVDLEGTEFEIGFGNDPEDVDPRASVNVTGGAAFTGPRIYVGSDEGFFGRLTASGVGTLVRATDDGTASEEALQVGRDGDGYLLIEGGAWLDLSDDDAELYVGANASAVGRAIIRGDLTLATIGQDIVVGDAGVGRMEITGGAIVRTEDTSAAGVTIGRSFGGVGEMLVDGPLTRLLVGDDLTVGGAGHGTLVISNQAVVDADNSASPIATVGVEGRLSLQGGTLLVNSLAVNGIVEGWGVIRGPGSGSVAINTGGRVDVPENEVLRIDDSATNQGSVRVLGGEIEFLESFTNNAAATPIEAGRVELQSGTARFTGDLTNDGVIAATSGSSDLFGEVTNTATGTILVARDSVLTFQDNFTNTGGTVSVLTGGTALFLGDASFVANSMLSLALDDENIGTGPLLSVSGVADLGGELQVTLPSNFEPEAGQSFTLIEANQINGEFIPPLLPTLEGGLALELVSTSDALLLEVGIDTSALGGDFNNDGVVDAADYTVWRDGLGVTFTQADYDTWVANYGTTTGSAASVPEPTALGVAMLAFAQLAAVSRRRSS